MCVQKTAYMPCRLNSDAAELINYFHLTPFLFCYFLFYIYLKPNVISILYIFLLLLKYLQDFGDAIDRCDTQRVELNRLIVMLDGLEARIARVDHFDSAVKKAIGPLFDLVIVV